MSSELDLDFTTGSVPAGIAVTRSGSAWYFNSSGVLTSASANTARIDYDPSTLAIRGQLIEEPRTQSIRNATGSAGLVAGTPGSLPTNWVQQANATGVTRTIVGTGTVNGMPYVDIQYAGSATASDGVLFFEPSSGVATVNATTWTSSLYLALIAGSLTNVTVKQGMRFRAAAGANIGTQIYETTFVPTATLTRYERTATGSDATIAFVAPSLCLTCATGAVDLTLRISIPQLELGGWASSPIVTTTATITRQGDVTNISSGTFWNATEGTMYAEFHSPKQTSLTATSVIFGASNGAFTETIYLSASTIADAFSVQDGGVGQVALSVASPPLTAKRVVGAYKANDFAMSRNGSAATTDSSGTVPTGMSQWRIGCQAWSSGSANYANAWMRRVRYWPVRYPNGDLPSLSSAPVSITGTGAATLEDLTSAASGLHIIGTGAATLEALTGAGAGSHIEPRTGTAASTFDALAGAGAGIFIDPITGTGASTFDALTGTGAGSHIEPRTGTGASTLEDLLAVSATGAFLAYGPVATVLEDLGQTASGGAWESIFGYSTIDLATLTSSGSGAAFDEAGTGTAETVLASATSTASGGSTSGAAAVSCADLTGSAAGTFLVSGTGAGVLVGLESFGFGTAYRARRVRQLALIGSTRATVTLNATVR